MVALLLVPVGVLWLATRYFSGLATRRRGLTLITIVVAALVWAGVSLGAWMLSGILGALLAVAGVYVMTRTIRHLRQAPGAPVSADTIGLYLTALPIVVVALQWAVVPAAIEFSRNRAIRNGAQLIADIERYHATNGRYPVSVKGL